MGMFDYIRIEYPVPEFEQYGFDGQTLFQTKDLECLMMTYSISADGQLMTPEIHSMDAPSVPWVDMWSRPYHGRIRFYEVSELTGEFVDFEAKFIDGRIEEVILISTFKLKKEWRGLSN